jgi:hypothetical protein
MYKIIEMFYDSFHSENISHKKRFNESLHNICQMRNIALVMDKKCETGIIQAGQQTIRYPFGDIKLIH